MGVSWKLATWNVNSIKVRAPAVLAWLHENPVDLLALQELKTAEEGFPAALFAEAGYSSAVHGQKTWNGVALLSRGPIEEITRGLPEMGDDGEARFLSASREGVRVIDVYVPNGAVVGSDKYAYKLRWLDALARHIERLLAAREEIVVAGDFNVAPEERDIYDPVAFRDQVLFSEPERAAIQRLLGTGLCDLFRHFHEEAGLYSWWDYRSGAFRRNLGARLDLVLVTPGVAERAIGCGIDIEPRRADKPSDHAPLWVEFR